MMFKKKKIGIALGEGGARGLVHIGVLQILKEHGIEVDIIAGTSIGAIVGAMYCETLDPFEVESRFKELIKSDLYIDLGFLNLRKKDNRQANFWDQIYSKVKGTIALTLAQTRLGILDGERFRKAIDFLIKIKSFEECKIPFTAVATDLSVGRDIGLCIGDIRQSVLASASIPGFFPPVKMDNRILSDGAISCPVPVKYIKSFKDTITICVAIPPKIKPHPKIENGIDVLIRCEEINLYYLVHEMIKGADICVIPDTQDIEWTQFDRIDELIKIGRKAGEEIILRNL